MRELPLPRAGRCLQSAVLVLVLALSASMARAALPSNPILFVTQIPIPDELNDGTVSNVAVSVVSALGNHLADTRHAARGGDLWLRYPNGALLNLTRAANLGVSGSQDSAGIAVRDPQVHWSGTRALLSLVVGAPAAASDNTTFFWQLYELTNLTAVIADSNTVPAFVHVSNQPTQYNNVMACYGTDGRIVFACDRPRNGAAHLYPQLDEYNNIPSNTGLWSLDPATGHLFQIDHSPSGSFHPFVDSFGRVLFSRWDHLAQDRNATDDRMGRATNGTFNYFDENSTAYNLGYRPDELFPEPRSYDSNLLAVLKVQGNAINSFFPWVVNEDGTDLEFLNHVGRHELLQSFRGSSFTNDPNLVQIFNLTPNARFNTNFLNNILQIREDPNRPGTYFGTDAPDFGTHAAGQILTLFGPPSTNADRMVISYVTPLATKGPNATGVYRDPCPTTNGALVAVYSPGTALDINSGTPSAPVSSYAFRIVTLKQSGSTWTNEQFLTPGLTNAVSYWVGATRVTYAQRLWELQPVEVTSRPVPPRQQSSVDPIEAQVCADEGVDIPVLKNWMRTNDLALLVSRNVTRRDGHDREQPFNLRVPGTATQTLGTNTGKIYDVRYIQFLQGDQLRGLTYGTTTPVPGRRVLATPMHDAAATAFNVPAPLGPSGSTRLGDDGSQATFVPARRALTHQLTDTNGNHVVRERYWITYQPGEIRTCAVCHGLNTSDQAGQAKPTNAPAALRDLLRYWKQEVRYSKILSRTQTNGVMRFDISGAPHRANVLEASPDLIYWQAVATNAVSTNGLFVLDDPQWANHTRRFYRVSVLGEV